jgi:hypothetical protein
MFARVLLALIQGFLLQRSWEPGLDPRRYRDTVTSLLDHVLPRSC